MHCQDHYAGQPRPERLRTCRPGARRSSSSRLQRTSGHHLRRAEPARRKCHCRERWPCQHQHRPEDTRLLAAHRPPAAAPAHPPPGGARPAAALHPRVARRCARSEAASAAKRRHPGRRVQGRRAAVCGPGQGAEEDVRPSRAPGYPRHLQGLRHRKWPGVLQHWR